MHVDVKIDVLDRGFAGVCVVYSYHFFQNSLRTLVVVEDDSDNPVQKLYKDAQQPLFDAAVQKAFFFSRLAN
jgi:hypothetical protein